MVTASNLARGHCPVAQGEPGVERSFDHRGIRRFRSTRQPTPPLGQGNQRASTATRVLGDWLVLRSIDHLVEYCIRGQLTSFNSDLVLKLPSYRVTI